MTVAELIAKLQTLPQDLPVVRMLDEFGTFEDLLPNCRVRELYHRPSNDRSYGKYAAAGGAYSSILIGLPFDAVEIDAVRESNG